MTLIYSLRISVTLPSGRVAAKAKETSNVFQIMRKNFITKMALLALSSTKKVKDKEKNSIGEETERDGTGEEASRSRVDFDWWK